MRWNRRIAVCAMAAALAGAACGCAAGNQVKEQVLGMTGDAADQGEGTQNGDEGAGQAGAAGQSGGAAGQAGSESGRSDAGQSNGAKGQPGASSMAAQLDAPASYQTELSADAMKVTADAPVRLPDVSRMGTRTVEKVSLTLDDAQHFMDVTGEEGISWGEGITWGTEDDGSQESGQSMTVFSEDQEYELSFVSGEQAGATPILWLTNRVISDGSDDEFLAPDASEMDVSEEEKRALEEELTAKAEDLLGRLESEEFILSDREWRAIRTKEDKDWVFKGEYGLQIHYVRAVDGAALPENRAGAMGKRRGQYVTFLYRTDGRLLTVKDISKEAVGEPKEQEFYLPFSAVSQIFEQFCKTCYNETAKRYKEDWGGELQAFDIHIKEVNLEYWMQMDQDGAAGELIPAWAFYGSSEITGASGTEKQEMQQILTVDARDGSILQSFEKN